MNHLYTLWHPKTDEQYTTRLWCLLAGLLFFSASASAQTISGTVFRDFNADGTYTAVPTSGTYSYGEPGVPGVVVTAYPLTGAPVSATTSATGSYTITGVTGQARIEFTNLLTSTFDSFRGGGSGTSVQFVTAPATNVNLGINAPDDYCQANPRLVIPCYENGSGTGNTNPVIVSIDYTDSGVSTQNVYPTGATADAVGSTWGTAYQKSKKLAFVSAFLKRQAGLGSRDLDGIYVLDYATATPTLLGGFDLQGVVPSNGGAALDFGTVTRVLVAATVSGNNVNELSADRAKASRDDDAYGKVGKVGYGDIDIDQATNTLWAVNLKERSLVAIDISSTLQGTAVPNNVPAAKVKRYFIDGTTAPFITGLPACPSGVMRPFGLGIHNGIGYLGVVCDGSSLTGSDMTASQQAYVLSFDPKNPTAFTQVTSVPLNYNREQGWVPFVPTATFDALESDKWQRWNDTYTDPTVTGSGAPSTDYYKTGINGTFVGAPQPILSDIDFLPNGDLVLGFMDRFAHQQGWANYIPGTTLELRSAVSQGDVLLASRSGTSYLVEGPTINDNFANPAVPANAQAAQLLTDGPSGRGEFFYTDYFIGNDASHPETALGGLAVLPGSNELTAVSFDPAAFNSMGIRWMNSSTGSKSRVYTVVANTTVANFGKGSGLGDVELLCNPSPIQIGNRVWNDLNNNGIQDAGEPALAGVNVILKGPGSTTVATVTTNSTGEYYFSNATGTNATGFAYNLTSLTSGSSYSLCFPTSLSALSLSTKPNSATGANADAIDSDPNAAGVISFTLGAAGQNTFVYDAGYALPVCSLTTTALSGTCNPASNLYTATGTISLTSTTGGTATITDGARSTTVTIAASATSVPYSISGLTSGTGSHTVVVNLPGCGSATATYTAPASCTPVLQVVVSTPACNSLTNQYTATGTVSLTNAQAGSLTITDNGTTIATIALTTNQTSATFSATGVSGSTPPSHTVVATLTDGTSASTTYATPTSCTVAPCSLTTSVTSTTCNPANNTYSSTVSVTLTQPIAGVITLTDGTRSLTLSVTNSTSSVSGTFNGLISDGTTHLVSASLTGCGSASTSYTAPTSCSAAPPCSISATATAGLCDQAANTYSATVVVTVTNPVAGALTVATGGLTQTLSTTGNTSSNTLTFVFNGLISDGLVKTVSITSSATACAATSTTYTAPPSCTVCSLSLATTSLPAGQVGTAYSQTLTTTGATGAISFTLASGTLPAGLSLSAGGIITGTPSATGTASFVAKVTDDKACTATASLTIAVAPVPTPFCSLTVTPTAGACTTLTSGTTVSSVFSSTVTVQFVANTPAGSLAISDGTSATTIAVAANQTTATVIFVDLPADGSTRTVGYGFTSGATDCGAFALTYVAPASCQPAPSTPQLSLTKLVDKSKAAIGETISYTLVLTNTGSVTASTTVSDLLSGGAVYVAGSASAPAGTTFTPGSPVNLWNVASITPGTSLSLTFAVTASAAGVVYNTASIPGDTVSVCTSVPVQVCPGDIFEYEITAKAGRSSYRWYRKADGVTTELTSFTTNVLSVTQVGEYSLAVDNVAGKCPDFSCCPFLIEEVAPVASFSLVASVLSCSGTVGLTDGTVTVTGLTATTATGPLTYQVAKGGTDFESGVLLTATKQALPGTGIVGTGLDAGTYRVRVYNAAGCYRDAVVVIAPANCACPPAKCVPLVIQQSKKAPRIVIR